MRTPGYIAVSMIASALAAGLAVKDLYDVLSGSASKGSMGIGGLADTLANGFFLLFVAGCVSAAILVYALAEAAMRSEPSPRGNLIAIAVTVVAVVAGHYPQHLFANVAVATFNAVRPDHPSKITAQELAHLIVQNAAWSLCGAIVLIIIVGLLFLWRHTMRPARAVAIALTVMTLVPVINGLQWAWRWRASLNQVATSGDPKYFLMR